MDRAHDQPIADTISHDLHGLLHAITIMPHARANGGNGRAEPLTSQWQDRDELEAGS